MTIFLAIMSFVVIIFFHFVRYLQHIIVNIVNPGESIPCSRFPEFYREIQNIGQVDLSKESTLPNKKICRFYGKIASPFSVIFTGAS